MKEWRKIPPCFYIGLNKSKLTLQFLAHSLWRGKGNCSFVRKASEILVNHN